MIKYTILTFKFIIFFIVITGCGTNTNIPINKHKSSSDLSDSNNKNISLSGSKDIFISEVLASNKSIIKDPDFKEYVDYIELYNNGDSKIDISGYGIGNNPDKKIWHFPKGTKISSKGYLLIWADGKNQGLHTNFKLSSSGEYVILYDKKNHILDNYIFGKQKEDISVARREDGNLYKAIPTPGVANQYTNQPDIEIAKPSSAIYINEFLAANVNNNIDTQYYEFSDWIELYNSNDQDTDISGYSISDKIKKIGWKLPNNTIIPAKSYLIIWADKQSNGIHTNFSLSSEGESIVLRNKAGKTIDFISYGKQSENISYGRDPNTYAWGYMEPSFKQTNKNWHITNLHSVKPTFSLASGFYEGTQKIQISTNDGGTIYYTLDGSYPTYKDHKYTTPIIINKTTTIRAITYTANKFPSHIKTETYILDFDTSLPVVSLSTNPDYLFDDMIGIYTKGKNGIPLTQCSPSHTENVNYARDWKRPMHIEYFASDHQKAFSLDLDSAISGQCSRALKKKSFKFNMESKYGKKNIKYKLYSDKKIQKISDFKIRGGYRGIELGDLLAAALTKSGNLDIDYQAYTTVQMFMNGEYWGVYNIREMKGKGYLKSNYPNLNSDVDIIDASSSAKKGSMDDYYLLERLATNYDLSNNFNYQKIAQVLDINNFIDYMCLMIYSGNDDWLHSNHRCWKEKKSGAKWRWMLDDLDRGFQNWDSVMPSNTFLSVTEASSVIMAEVFTSLLNNQNFKQQFKNRFNALLDTTFSPENVLKIINNLSQKHMQYLAIEESKWGLGESEFSEYIQGVREFAQKRRDIVRQQLALF